MLSLFFVTPLQLFLFVNYLNLLLYLVLNCTGSFFVVWFCIEFHMISFIFWSYFLNNSFEAPYLLYYFLVQSLSSLILLWSYYLLFYSSVFSLVFVVFFLLKLGVIPFSGWYYRVINNINFVSVIMAFTQQKFPSYLLLFCAITNFDFFSVWLDLLFVIILLSTFLSAVLGLYSVDLISILIWSSVINSVWILLVLVISVFWFLVFWVIYFYFLLVLISQYFTSFDIGLLGLLSLVTLAGFPPFPVFFFNFFSVCSLLNGYVLGVSSFGVLNFPLFFSVVLLFISSIVIIIYFQLVLSYLSLQWGSYFLKHWSSSLVVFGYSNGLIIVGLFILFLVSVEL